MVVPSMNTAGIPVNTVVLLIFASQSVVTRSVTPARSWLEPPNRVQMKPQGALNLVLVSKNVIIDTTIEVTYMFLSKRRTTIYEMARQVYVWAHRATIVLK